jgi:hypothetical protein
MNNQNNQSLNIQVPTNLRNISDQNISDARAVLDSIFHNIIHDPITFSVLNCLGNIVRYTIAMMFSQMEGLDNFQKSGIIVLLWLYIMQVNIYTIRHHFPSLDVSWYNIMRLSFNLPIYLYMLININISWNMLIWLLIYAIPIVDDYLYVNALFDQYKRNLAKQRILKNIVPTESNESQCPICKEDLTDPHKINCNHAFHRECLIQHINNGSLICPMCRQPY